MTYQDHLPPAAAHELEAFDTRELQALADPEIMPDETEAEPAVRSDSSTPVAAEPSDAPRRPPVIGNFTPSSYTFPFQTTAPQLQKIDAAILHHRVVRREIRKHDLSSDIVAAVLRPETRARYRPR